MVAVSTLQTSIWRKPALLLSGLALSVGWGIRGNFGHEYGAAFAGCLSAIVVALVAGRSDWRERVLYFAFFGAIGWGFGGSISYMQVISYTQSGHGLSQWYGYVGLFYIGFLWAALGGAGTALAAVAERKQLVNLFKPVLVLFGFWFVLDLVEDSIAEWIQSGIAFDATWSRHKNPLYWLDADYMAALWALLAMAVYDLYNRAEKNGLLLPIFAAAGALAGWGIQSLLNVAGLDTKLATWLTYPLGDPSYVNPETGLPAFEPHNFLNNWPQWFGDYPQHIGWIVGLLAGITAYFIRFGKFRDGASLIVYMASGWLLFFLAIPVLGSIWFADYGGLRMTPPRSDDWAGITGVFLGATLWFQRNKLLPVAVASVICGTIGGLGFSGMQWIRQLMMVPGNPRRLIGNGLSPDSFAFKSITADWAGWQHQNWHSFLEQTYGFVNGLALIVALGYLATRIPIHNEPNQTDEKSGRWTLGVAAVFVWLAIPYVNLVKNLDDWRKNLNPEVWTMPKVGASGEVTAALWDVPYLGKLPGVALQLTPTGWFNVTWLLILGLFIVLIRRHFREPLALIPATWLGRGQLIYLILLWLMVIGNFDRALVSWEPGRLLTEWVITVNAILSTLLVLVVPHEREVVTIRSPASFTPIYRQVWLRAVAAVVVSGLLFVFTNRLIYSYPANEKPGKMIHTRFGPEADWRAKPNLKNALHK